MMSREQAQALTRAVHLLRPAWNEEGIFAALARVKDRDPFEVALAAFRAAQDPKAKTPGVIPTEGPHWNELPPSEKPKDTWRPPRKDEDCKVHVGQWADNCSGCAADRRVGTVTKPGDPRKPDRTAQLDTLRRINAEIRAGLCRHDVDRGRVRCGECDVAEKPRRQPQPEEV